MKFSECLFEEKDSRQKKETREQIIRERSEKNAVLKVWVTWKYKSKPRREKYRVLGDVIERIDKVTREGMQNRSREALSELFKDSKRKMQLSQLDKLRKHNDRKRKLRSSFHGFIRNKQANVRIKKGVASLKKVLVTKATKHFVFNILRNKAATADKLVRLISILSSCIQTVFLKRGFTNLNKEAQRDRQISIIFSTRVLQQKRQSLTFFFKAWHGVSIRRARVDVLKDQLQEKANCSVLNSYFVNWKEKVIRNPNSLYSLEAKLKKLLRVKAGMRTLREMAFKAHLRRDRFESLKSGLVQSELAIRRAFGLELLYKLKSAAEWRDSLEFYVEKIEKALAKHCFRIMVHEAKQSKAFDQMVVEFRARHTRNISKAG